MVTSCTCHKDKQRQRTDLNTKHENQANEPSSLDTPSAAPPLWLDTYEIAQLEYQDWCAQFLGLRIALRWVEVDQHEQHFTRFPVEINVVAIDNEARRSFRNVLCHLQDTLSNYEEKNSD